MAILRGHFAMTLIVEGAERAELDADLAELGLEAYSVAEVAEAPRTRARSRTPSSRCTAPTTPGIVAAVTRVLADAGVNVCDLQTRLAARLYVMIIDVSVPPGLALEELDRRLQAIAAEQDVAITLRAADADVL
jgi:glycine cleavage system transcriptional repressor